MIDALAIAREHLATRDREASDTECSECGMRNPPSRPASACGMEFLTHDGCPAAGGAFIPAVSPWGRRQCLGVAESDAVCEAVVALTAEVERLRAEFAASQPALDALKAPITRRIAPSVAVDVDDDGDLVVVTRSEAEAFAAAHPYAAGAILGGVAHRSEGGDRGA